jgi:hypothetical protein
MVNSELKEGDLMLWIMDGPVRGTDLNDEFRTKSLELKSKIRNLKWNREEKHG